MKGLTMDFCNHVIGFSSASLAGSQVQIDVIRQGLSKAAFTI